MWVNSTSAISLTIAPVVRRSTVGLSSPLRSGRAERPLDQDLHLVAAASLRYSRVSCPSRKKMISTELVPSARPACSWFPPAFCPDACIRRALNVCIVAFATTSGDVSGPHAYEAALAYSGLAKSSTTPRSVVTPGFPTGPKLPEFAVLRHRPQALTGGNDCRRLQTGAAGLTGRTDGMSCGIGPSLSLATSEAVRLRGAAVTNSPYDLASYCRGHLSRPTQDPHNWKRVC